MIAAAIIPAIKRARLPPTEAQIPNRQHDLRLAPTTAISGPNAGDTASLAGWSILKNWISLAAPPFADPGRCLEPGSVEMAVEATTSSSSAGCSRLPEGKILVWPRTSATAMSWIARRSSKSWICVAACAAEHEADRRTLSTRVELLPSQVSKLPQCGTVCWVPPRDGLAAVDSQKRSSQCFWKSFNRGIGLLSVEPVDTKGLPVGYGACSWRGSSSSKEAECVQTLTASGGSAALAA